MPDHSQPQKARQKNIPTERQGNESIQKASDRFQMFPKQIRL